MRKQLTTVGTMFALLLSMLVSVSFLQQPAHAATGFDVRNGKLYDANGNEFIFRGVAHPQVWFQNEMQAYGDIASLGANSVRVVLSSGHQWDRSSASEVQAVVSECKANELICILEVHDTTGYGSDSSAVPLSEAVDYWISIQDALEGSEEYVVINIGNEPIGNDKQVVANWPSVTLDAVNRMRAAGYDHTLLLNAPNWGQDWSHTMRDNAEWVYNNTPNGNVMFSIHMYGVYSSASTVRDYLTSFTSRGLPIIVGEFGFKHSDGDVAEDAIMRIAEELGIGYMGWSWSGNGSSVDYLDMVNDFNVNSLTSWGQRIFYGPNGIQETAEDASVYGDDGNDDGGDSDLPEPGGDCVVDYTVQNQWGSGFTGSIEITNNGSAVTSWTLKFEFTAGQTITNGWKGNFSQSGSTVTISSKGWNGSVGTGETVSAGFNATYSGANPAPENFTFNGTSCTIS